MEWPKQKPKSPEPGNKDQEIREDIEQTHGEVGKSESRPTQQNSTQAQGSSSTSQQLNALKGTQSAPTQPTDNQKKLEQLKQKYLQTSQSNPTPKPASPSGPSPN